VALERELAGDAAHVEDLDLVRPVRPLRLLPLTGIEDDLLPRDTEIHLRDDRRSVARGCALRGHTPPRSSIYRAILAARPTGPPCRKTERPGAGKRRSAGTSTAARAAPDSRCERRGEDVLDAVPAHSQRLTCALLRRGSNLGRKRLRYSHAGVIAPRET